MVAADKNPQLDFKGLYLVAVRAVVLDAPDAGRHGVAEVEDLPAIDWCLSSDEDQQMTGFQDLTLSILTGRWQTHHLVGGDEWALDLLQRFAALAATTATRAKARDHRLLANHRGLAGHPGHLAPV